MAEMPNISLYTARTWAFLCDRTKLVIEHWVSRVAAIIGKEVVPSRMSYAGQVPYQISFCQTTLRIGAATNAPSGISTQCKTYRSPTIDTSCRNMTQDQRMFQTEGEGERQEVVYRTMVHLPSAFGTLGRCCRRGRRRGFRLRLQPIITCAILFHDIELSPYVLSIGWRPLRWLSTFGPRSEPAQPRPSNPSSCADVFRDSPIGFFRSGKR